MQDRSRGAYLPLIGLWDHKCCKPQSLVTHGQCDAIPTVTFLTTEYRRPSTSTKSYYTKSNVREQL